MNQPKWMFRRGWEVAHGRDGFVLHVRDEWVPYLVADKVVHGLLVALGHPCCDRGPLGWLSRSLPGKADDLASLFWYRVLNLPNRLARFSRPVADLPLTFAEALTLAPHWRDKGLILINGVDEDGNTWHDGVLVKEAEA